MTDPEIIENLKNALTDILNNPQNTIQLGDRIYAKATLRQADYFRPQPAYLKFLSSLEKVKNGHPDTKPDH